MKDKEKKEFLDLASKVAKESGTSLEKMLGGFEKNWHRVAKIRKSESGKYKVLGIDKFSNEDWVHGEYETAEEALAEARKLTKEGMDYASDCSIATVYYAYDPKGKYLGGDVWNGE